jgi:cytochrome b pre-mRNA-processing protein 3
MIAALRYRRRRAKAVAQLCAAVSRRAREPVFYREFRVADSIDGRFDMVVLHAWLVLERLQKMEESALAQDFVDALFNGFDQALREQGAGDVGVGRRVKKMAGAFCGRMRAYSESGKEDGLAAAILRNVYRGEAARVEHAALLAKYVAIARREIANSRLASGELNFAPIPSL